MNSDRRKSTRKKCPARNAQLVVFKNAGSDDELFSNLQVQLKSYPCRIVPTKNGSDSKENVCPSSKTLTRRNRSHSGAKRIPSDVTSDEDLLLDMKAKKYPTRRRVPLHSTNSNPDVNSGGKVISEKSSSKKTPVRKSALTGTSRKSLASASSSKKVVSSSSKTVSAQRNQNTKINVDSDDSSDYEVSFKDKNKCVPHKKGASSSIKNVLALKNRNRKTNVESDDSSDYEVSFKDENKCVPPHKKGTSKKSLIHASNGEGSDDDFVPGNGISEDDFQDSSANTKSYPTRKRKGNPVPPKEKDSNNNSLNENELKKKKSLSKASKNENYNTDDCTDNEESVEMKEGDGEVCLDVVQMKSERDEEHAEVFNVGNSTPAMIDAEEENTDTLVSKEKEIVDEEDTEEENMVRARVLTSNALDGQSIYGFVTPKRKDALAKIAQDVIESAKQSSKKSAKKSSRKSSAPTPKSSKKPGKSSTSKEDDNDAKESDRKTRNKVNLLRTLAANDSEEDEDEDEEQSESEESGDNEESPGKSTSQKRNDGRDILDEYFEVHGKTKSLTSDKTLGKLKNPKMDQQELLQHLKDVQSSHINEIVKLHRLHQSHYKTWMFNLLSGFNVLVYGLGSKHMLLEKFRKTMLQDREHIVVNGFFPSIQLKQILKTITEEILERDNTFKNVIEHYKYITKEYNSGCCGKLFIIIHNIDGHMLRSQNVQTALAHLASSSNIHVIASIDHINAPLIWDQNRASTFNWLWYDTTTFESYSEETSYENSLMVQQSGTLALSSLKHVLHSLTSNSKGIFKVLADYHLDNEDNTSYQGMSFGDLYQRCRERFLVNSDLTLRGQLTEFRDHKLIKSKKGVDGVEYLSIALDCATLRIYLEGEDG